ncbi:hypothetical protein CWI38_0040p0100 [Hamiltosporidium tvaerminnensis]|uniref:Uncharacterized protein n=1 Tax=Hamiltosporidium tvaerminnensis TaxID=1176355 RepID=A0A4Q9M4Z5_9MICR|nr:hypothetical protein CWI38_0040p0100 [Hamiltosporidium tvaerminnensis]
MNVEAYIQSIVLKKTVEIFSFNQQTGLETRPKSAESCKKLNNEEADGNTQNKKNVKPYILDCVTTVKELTMNINEKSDLEIKK